MAEKKYLFRFPSKFTDNQLDTFVDGFYQYYNKSRSDGEYEFDLSDVEWMSNQEMLVLTAIFKYLVESDVDFKVHFLKNGSTAQIDRRVANQIVQIWYVWRIFQVAPDGKFEKYFDIHGNIVQVLIKKFGLKPQNIEIYDRYGITPFITLDKIAHYDDRLIGEMLSETYRLSQATNEVLEMHNCNMPFENHTLGSIITKELYENFLDHASGSLFTSSENFAFLSLSLTPKLDDTKKGTKELQDILTRNFREESNPEFKSFFYDSQLRMFKNRSLLQFSFLDFGPGIVSTLRSEYLRRNPETISEAGEASIDAEVLKLAFEYDSSKDPLEKRYLDKTVIPRGLYDLISIVRRFNGLLIARSNFGKIYFDFSNDTGRFNDGKEFGDGSKFFPGTLITIYLPERRNEEKFDASQIVVPAIQQFKAKQKLSPNYISLYKYLKSLEEGELTKGELYSKLFDSIVKEITKADHGHRIHYFDFYGFDIDERVTRKIIHFLVSDYNINSANNIIVLNPPPDEFLKNLNNEILQLNLHVKSYRLHPIPFVRKKDDGIDVFWMGVYNQRDAEKLNDLLMEQNDLRKSDFEDPGAVAGNVNFYDDHGNLHSYIDVESIATYFEKKNEESTEEAITPVIKKYIRRAEGKVFLCPGNYYQDEYLQLYDAINNSDECKLLANALLNEINRNVKIDETFKLICVTASSQQIIKYFDFDKGKAPKFILLDNYHTIHDTSFMELVGKDDKVILICDVFSTGYMTNIISSRLEQIGASLVHIAVLVDAMDEEFEPQKIDNTIKEKLISVVKLKMVKYRRKDISDKLIGGELEVVRINPYTNTPIQESLADNPLTGKVLLDNSEFIDLIDESHVKAGYFRFNNLIHPYFFDMEGILNNPDIAKKLLLKIFEKLKHLRPEELEILFYPKGSAIQQLDFDLLKSEIFKNHSIVVSQLERFQTNEGWRFPHPPKFMYEIAKGKRALIIDDGSCSGESLMQMIDEVATLEVGEVIVISIIGRLNDHKKDFFTRMNTIIGRSGDIPVSVYFGVHWHIPTYYIEESPIIREKHWLESVSNIANIPGKIKRTAENILDELHLKDVKEDSNRYLLKRRDTLSIIKDLILVKEEIGKITSYRYYKEYFSFFDEFIRQYEGGDRSEDRYKMIESICAVFLHEPNLYQKVKTILPDLTEKIEVFIQTILFGNPEKASRLKLPKSNLFYKWSNKNIIHLFFIVFRNEVLFEKLSVENMITIIKNFTDNESDLYYLFYRMLKFLPINGTDVSKKPFAGRMKHLIEVLKENSDLDSDTKRHIKRFSIFVSSLPEDQLNFIEALATMKRNYVRISDDAFHNEFIFNDKQIVASQLRLLVKYKKEDKPIIDIINVIRARWEAISVFVSRLLSFYKSYSQFFFNHNFITDGPNGKKSLAKMLGIVDEAIHDEDFSNVENLIEIINEIFNEFILENSFPYKLFHNISVQNIKVEFEKFIVEIKKQYPDLNVRVTSSAPSIPLNIPLIYLTEVIFKELKSNFRHVDNSSPIQFKWDEDAAYAKLTISNKIKGSVTNGGGYGLNKLNLFNEFPISINYSNGYENGEFIQNIKLSKI